MQYHLGHGLHNELIQPATAGTTRRMNTVAMTPLPRLLDGNRNCAALAPRQRHRYRGGPLVPGLCESRDGPGGVHHGVMLFNDDVNGQ